MIHRPSMAFQEQQQGLHMSQSTAGMCAKRLACDRCHALKMRCVVDQGASGQVRGNGRCNRCRSAQVACYYSPPGRSGRPSTRQTHYETLQMPLVSTRNIRPAISTPASFSSAAHADAQSMFQSTITVNTSDLETDHHRRQSSASIQQAPHPSQNEVDDGDFDFRISTDEGPKSPEVASWLDMFAVQGDGAQQQEQEAMRYQPHQQLNSGFASNLNEFDDMNHHGDQDDTQQLGSAKTTESSLTSSTLAGTTTARPSTATTLPVQDSKAETEYGGQRYLQRLSEFNAQIHTSHSLLDITLKMGILEEHAEKQCIISASQLEQGATHVLQHSALFVELLRHPSSPVSRSSASSPRASMVHDTPTRLQLVVSYMRLAELHYGLYTAAYTHLRHQEQRQPQQHHHHNNKPNEHDPQRCPSFSLSVAGVQFPNPMISSFSSYQQQQHHTRFQLQLILQTSAHYLCRIQEELGLPAPMRLTALSPTTRTREAVGNANGSVGLLGQRGSAEAALLGHMLMMHYDNRGWEGDNTSASEGGGGGGGGGVLLLQKISHVFERLMRDFGILVVSEVT